MEAVEVLSKVTGLTQGLFNEISSKTRGMLTQKIFECQSAKLNNRVQVSEGTPFSDSKNNCCGPEREVEVRRKLEDRLAVKRNSTSMCGGQTGLKLK